MIEKVNFGEGQAVINFKSPNHSFALIILFSHLLNHADHFDNLLSIRTILKAIQQKFTLEDEMKVYLGHAYRAEECF